MLFRLIIISVTIASSCYAGVSSGGSDHPPDVSNILIEWLRANGAYINEKLEVKHVVPDDPSSPRGVFATEDMDEGETLCSIPFKLIVEPKKEHMERLPPDYEDCGAIKAVMEAMSGDDINPYGQYLLHQPKGYLPTFWSEAGKDLLAEMLKSTRSEQLTEYDELPPHNVQGFVDELERDCNGDVDDPFYLQAAMLVNARADYIYMIPFYDMFNHNNGKYNMKHKFDNYEDQYQEGNTGAEFVTTKSIKAGDELYNSYNRCIICDEYYDWHGTPEMFLQFGFVETMPQRWLFDFARVKFDLDWKDGDETTGVVVVSFLVPPSEKGMLLLQEELTRLNSFSTMHRNKSYNNYDGMSKYEWETLWQYYDALHDALSNAIGQSDASSLSDEIWELDDNWWVKDGTVQAPQEDWHSVLSTQSNEMLTDEL